VIIDNSRSKKSLWLVEKNLERCDFDVKKPVSDLTAAQMKGLIKTYAENEDFSSYSCFMIVLMSYSNFSNQIVCADDIAVSLDDDIIKPFKQCSTLQGKPKLFFVENFELVAHETHKEVNASERHRSFHVFHDYVHTDTVDDINRILDKRFNSGQDDFLVFSAITKEAKSDRNQSQGSVFIESLVQVIEQLALTANVEFETLLEKVNQRVSRKKIIPKIDNKLKKALYFNSDMNALVSAKR
jgi:hypothetical protein